VKVNSRSCHLPCTAEAGSARFTRNRHGEPVVIRAGSQEISRKAGGAVSAEEVHAHASNTEAKTSMTVERM